MKKDSDFLSVIAGIGGVNRGQVVLLLTSGLVIPADGTNVTHAGLVIGIAMTNIVAGAGGMVQRSGLIQNVLWSFDPGELYYLGVAGTLSKIPPVSGFWQRMGIAKNANTLLIDMGEPIKVI